MSLFRLNRLAFSAFSKMSRPKVLVADYNIPPPGVELLKEKCDVIICDEKPAASRKQILEKIKGVDAAYWSTKVRLDQEMLDAAGPQLKIVSSMSAGVNQIDIPELKRRGIKLGNTPSVLDNAVADVAVLLALGAARRLHEGRLKIENNDWVPGNQWMLGQDIEGSTVGIVGLGGIGQAIVKRLKAFQATRFLYSGHREKKEGKELGAEFVSLDALVTESDFVIVACPLTEETKHMFHKGVFNKMKKTAVFVNISRGEVVKQEDLIDALKNQTIFAAGLDVMTPEPLPSDHELLKLPNCVILPHLGSATFKTRSAMAKLAAQNILKALNGEEMLTPVY